MNAARDLLQLPNFVRVFNSKMDLILSEQPDNKGWLINQTIERAADEVFKKIQISHPRPNQSQIEDIMDPFSVVAGDGSIPVEGYIDRSVPPNQPKSNLKPFFST